MLHGWGHTELMLLTQFLNHGRVIVIPFVFFWQDNHWIMVNPDTNEILSGPSKIDETLQEAQFCNVYAAVPKNPMCTLNEEATTIKELDDL